MKLPKHVREFFKKQGKIGAAKRQATLTAERRREMAQKAAQTRWAKSQTKAAAPKENKRKGGTK